MSINGYGWILWCVIMSNLAACGNKGPLYLPKDEAAVITPGQATDAVAIPPIK
ncbi:MAG: lipoprotein [Gammaproteobacteria bacterium]|nr:lipoprotein [Gammaproteobacteria bacterium]